MWGEGEAAPPRGHEDGLGNLPGVRERQGGPSESGGRRAGLCVPPPPGPLPGCGPRKGMALGKVALQSPGGRQGHS